MTFSSGGQRMTPEAQTADGPPPSLAHPTGDPHTRPVIPPGWPALPLNDIEQGWQAAFDAGPARMGEQIAYALAFSRKRPERTALDLFPAAAPPAAPEIGLLARAAAAEALGVTERLALLGELQRLADPALRARGLLLLAPALALEKRREALRHCYDAGIAALTHPTTPYEAARLLVDLLAQVRAAASDELPGGLMAEVLDIASRVQGIEARLRSLTALAPHLSSTVRIALILAVLDSIAATHQPETQAGAVVALAPYLPGEVQHRALTVATHIRTPAARARALTALAEHLPSRLQPRLRTAALDAIASIVNETERAAAIAAFAPHLEQAHTEGENFPELLERALDLAVALQRRDARARALVGLQARLPRHLQGEALAVVNSITDEHQRAQLLAELAQNLPPDIAAVGALAVAHNIRQRDARFLALKALGKRLDGGAAERIWLDALAVALALPRQLEQVMALAELAPNLPDELRHRALSSALETTRAITRERARLRALATLAPLLAGEPELLAAALAEAHTLTSPLEHISALIAMLPYLPDTPTLEITLADILTALLDIDLEYRQTRALVSLAPHLYGTYLENALDIALRIHDPYDRTITLAALLPRVDDTRRRAHLLGLALEAAHTITDHYDRATALATLRPLGGPDQQHNLIQPILQAVRQIEDDYDRASGVAQLAPLLAEEERPAILPPETQVLREALLAICRLDSMQARARLFADIAPAWQALHPPRIAYALWCEVLVQLARRPPAHLLSDIAALLPLLQALGGRDAVRAAADLAGRAQSGALD